MNMERYVKKILVVEDDLALRPIWEKFFSLRSEKIILEWSVSCEEAIKMVRQANEQNENYFLIVSDIFLAGSKTGIQLLSSPEVLSSKARTVLVSAVDQNEIINKYGHLFPGTVVISKPFNFREYDLIFREIFNGYEPGKGLNYE